MSNKKGQNNRRKNKGKVIKFKRKKAKLNKKKLVLLIGIIAVFIFGLNKAVIGVSKVVKNIDEMKNQQIEKQKEEELRKQEIEKQKEEQLKKQFDLQEQEQGLGKKYTIVIDPGHGGTDFGNSGAKITHGKESKDIYEKDLNLEISKKIAGVLSNQKDVQVVLTRSEDADTSLEERVKIANSQQQKADVFVSIHMNAEAYGNSAYGIETYYRSEPYSDDKSEELAKTVQKTIGSYVSMRDRGAQPQEQQVLKNTTIPAVVVQCGFITNEKEEQRLLDEQYQNKLSEGIAQGILSFLDAQNSEQK